jgi:hypothetical protein
MSLFLPDSTKNLALVSLCCRKATTTLLGGAFASSLARYFSGSEHVVVSCIMVICIISLGVGGTVSTFANNITNEPAGREYAVGIAFQYTAAILLLGNSLYWLTKNLFPQQAHFLRELICGGLIAPAISDSYLHTENVGGNNTSPGSSASGDHGVVFFRAVHVITAVLYIFLQGGLQAAYKIANNATEMQVAALSAPMIIWALSILIRSMRQVKLAAFENLVSTEFDSPFHHYITGIVP